MPGQSDNRRKISNRSKLGGITKLFGGLLGGAANALQGRTKDKKGKIKKTARQRILDSL